MEYIPDEVLNKVYLAVKPYGHADTMLLAHIEDALVAYNKIIGFSFSTNPQFISSK